MQAAAPTTTRSASTARRIATSPSERDRLIMTHLSLVYATAGRIKTTCGRYLSYDELVACGMRGLVEAAHRFDPSQGVCFATFSYYRIRGSIMDGVRECGWYSRYDVDRYRKAKLRAEQRVNTFLQDRLEMEAGSGSPAAASAEETLRSIADIGSQIATVTMTSLDFVHQQAEDGIPVSEDALHVTDDRVLGPDEQLETKAMRARVRRAVASLPPQERRMIELHYFEDRMVQDIGATMGLSKWQACRLHLRAVKMLRDVLEEERVPD